MKLIVLLGVLVVVCIVLFIAGVVAPSRSRKMQRRVSSVARKAERRGDRKAGRFGNATRDGVKKMRHAAESSVRGGRRVGDKLRGD